MTADICVFDAYGTLFDVGAAARRAAQEPGGTRLAGLWPRLADDWRRKQLEYTWLRALYPHHADFRQVTADALDWALEAAGIDDAALRDRLMALYDRLEPYPEAAAALEGLRADGRRCAILSNGTPAMLATAIGSAGLEGAFDAVLSVEAAGVFKPDPRVYALVTAEFGVTPDRVLFVSANGWDAAGAAGFGFRSAWVNRAGAPADRLHARPHHVIADLRAVRALAAEGAAA